MTKTCTSTLNDVVRYIYDETSSSENCLIEYSISTDNEVLGFYLDCLEIKENLNQIDLVPKENTIKSILEYSKNFKPTIYS